MRGLWERHGLKPWIEAAIAPSQNGQAAFDQRMEVARQSRIAREDGALAETKWSFDAKLYLVK